MMLGLIPLMQRPQKDSDIGAFRCKSCGKTIFDEAWLCDDCQSAATDRQAVMFKVCLVLIAIGLVAATIALAIIR